MIMIMVMADIIIITIITVMDMITTITEITRLTMEGCSTAAPIRPARRSPA